MKTIKLLMIAAVVSVALMGNAENLLQKSDDVRVIKIGLRQAMHDPGLVFAMHQQLTPYFILEQEKADLYAAQVRYQNKIFEIHGTQEAWIVFFRTEPGGVGVPITDLD